MQYMYYRYMQTHLGSYLECSKVEKNKIRWNLTSHVIVYLILCTYDFEKKMQLQSVVQKLYCKS